MIIPLVFGVVLSDGCGPRVVTAAGYSDDERRLLLEFQGKLEEIMRGQLARLRGDDATPGGARSGGGGG